MTNDTNNSTDANTPPGTNGELQEYVCDRLGDHRDLLERLADLDTDLSEDAARVLEILDASRDGGQE